MKIATISSKRQITLPKKLLEELGVEKKDKLLLKVVGDRLTAEPVKTSIVDETAGSLTNMVKKEKLNKPFNYILEETKRKVARKITQDD